MVDLAAEITSTFIDTITALFEGVGSGVIVMFETLILNDAGDGLSSLAIWMIVFMGVSFALTIFYALWRKVA